MAFGRRSRERPTGHEDAHVLQRLAKGPDGIARELGELIEDEHQVSRLRMPLRTSKYHQGVDIRIQCVVVDAADCERLARFWSGALGWQITDQRPDEWIIEPPEGSPEADVAPDILFAKVPDAKSVKNRLHFDLRPNDQDAQVNRLIGLGADRVDIGQPDDVTWVVMADPEGNEFCVLTPLPTSQD